MTQELAELYEVIKNRQLEPKEGPTRIIYSLKDSIRF